MTELFPVLILCVGLFRSSSRLTRDREQVSIRYATYCQFKIHVKKFTSDFNLPQSVRLMHFFSVVAV